MAWNEWRRQNPSIRPDLSEADLTRMDLTWVNLSQANLSKTDLSGATLHVVNLSQAFLNNANLFQADLEEAKLAQADLSGANLSETTNLTQEQLEQAKGNAQTELPEHLTRPAAWSSSEGEDVGKEVRL